MTPSERRELLQEIVVIEGSLDRTFIQVLEHSKSDAYLTAFARASHQELSKRFAVLKQTIRGAPR